VDHPAGRLGRTTEGWVTGTEVGGCVAGMDVVGMVIVSEGEGSFGENKLHAKSKSAVVMENVKARYML